MALSQMDIESLIVAIQSDPALRDRVRSAILADDFLALPGVMRSLAQEVANLTEQVRQLTLRMDRLDGRLGNLDGEAYETRYVLNLGSHLARTLRRVQRVFPSDLEPIFQAYRAGEITTEEWDEIHRLDVLASGQSVTGSGSDAWAALELSLVVNNGDVERAHARAAILRRHGIDALPMVDGRAITPEAEELASALGVTVLVRKVAPAA